MGRKIKITENKLKQIISESVKRILKEGSNSSDDYNNWEQVKECLGCEGMLSELYNYLSGDQIREFIEGVDREYDLNIYTEEGYDEYEEYEEDEEDELYESLNEIGDTPKGQFALGAVNGKYDYKSMNGGDFNTNSQKAMEIDDIAYNKSNNEMDRQKQRDMWDAYQQGITYGHNKQYK
jgi:hypothetical protein